MIKYCLSEQYFMNATYPIITPGYWNDRPTNCEFCTHARPQFNSIKYGGQQLANDWWCDLHKYMTINHGCGDFEREPGVEG